MAHQWSRCNLLSAEFPMLTDLWGETVINPSGDMPNAAFGADDINKPRVYYMENVMPTSAGYQSVTLNDNPFTAPGMTALRYFSSIFKIKCPNPSFIPGTPATEFITVYIGTTTGALALWVLDSTQGPDWVIKSPPVSTTIFPLELTTAWVNGQTYLFIAGKGCFHWDITTHTFILDPLAGVTEANITGITGANGYMIAYGENSVLWSSLVDPLDFSPSLVTGAGGGQVGELKDQIVGAFNITGGFILYSFVNAVQASYTGNSQFPFKLQEIPASGGIVSNAAVSWQDNGDTHIIYGTKGLQTLSIGSNAAQIFPEVTEMLSAGYTEVFDSVNLVFNKINISFSDAFSVPISINMIGTRYIVISYDATTPTLGGGQYTTYSRALVYDRALSRWGKVVIDHVDVIEATSIGSSTVVQEFPTSAVNFVNFEGTLTTMDQQFTIAEQQQGNGISVLLLGKFQLQRNRGIYLQRAKFENLIAGQTWNCYALPTYDGKTFAPAVQLTNLVAADEESGLNIQTFGGRVYGKNVSVLLIGNFNLSSAQVDLVIGADD